MKNVKKIDIIKLNQLYNTIYNNINEYSKIQISN